MMLARTIYIDQWSVLFNIMLNNNLQILRVEGLDDSFQYFLDECKKWLGRSFIKDKLIRLNIRILSF